MKNKPNDDCVMIALSKWRYGDQMVLLHSWDFIEKGHSEFLGWAWERIKCQTMEHSRDTNIAARQKSAKVTNITGLGVSYASTSVW